MEKKKTEITKMTESGNGIKSMINMKGQKLGTVISLKYLGAIVKGDGWKTEVALKVTQATTALANLKTIWTNNKIAFASKINLTRACVNSIFLFAYQTLTADSDKRTNTSI